MSSIGERLKDLREELNMNQSDVSKVLNIGRSTIANHETDRREPSIEMLIKYSKLYSCSVDYLVGLTNNRTTTITEYDINGEKIIAETSISKFPNKLSQDELLEKIKIIEKLEKEGFTFPTKINKDSQ